MRALTSDGGIAWKCGGPVCPPLPSGHSQRRSEPENDVMRDWFLATSINCEDAPSLYGHATLGLGLIDGVNVVASSVRAIRSRSAAMESHVSAILISWAL